MKTIGFVRSLGFIVILTAPILIIGIATAGLSIYLFTDNRDVALWICGSALIASIALAPIAMKVLSNLGIAILSGTHSAALQIGLHAQDNNGTTKDKRRHTRYPVTCTATFSNEHLIGFGMIGNVSHSGCRLKGELKMTPGASGKLLIDVPGLAAPLQIAAAVVRWVTGSECGIEFTAIGLEEQKYRQWITELARKVELADVRSMAAS